MLKPGDVILTSETSLTSKCVRLGTLSKFSHAAIYVGGTIIEATLSGVFSKSPQRLLFDTEEQVLVLRYKKPLSDDQVKRICSYARSKTLSLYTVHEALTLKFRRNLKLPESKKQFCSRLVALAYHENGIILDKIQNPAYCTPKQLSLSKSFERVKDILLEATTSDIEFANTEDPNIKHQRETMEWVNKVRELVSSLQKESEFDIQTINDVNEFLTRNPAFDDDVMRFINSGGYLTYYKYDFTKNPYRTNARIFESTANERNDKKHFLNSEISISEASIYYQPGNLLGYLKYYKENNLSYFLEHCKLYLNLITATHTRMDILCDYCKKYNFTTEYARGDAIRREAEKYISLASDIKNKQ